jgi:hypothetical protein
MEGFEEKKKKTKKQLAAPRQYLHSLAAQHPALAENRLILLQVSLPAVPQG